MGVMYKIVEGDCPKIPEKYSPQLQELIKLWVSAETLGWGELKKLWVSAETLGWGELIKLLAGTELLGAGEVSSIFKFQKIVLKQY